MIFICSQERFNRTRQNEADLKSGGPAVPAEFMHRSSQHSAPDDTPRGRFHIRGYKGTRAYTHLHTCTRTLKFASTNALTSGHIAGAVHLCGESFSRISEKALLGKHVETLNLSDKTALNFPQPQPAQYVNMLKQNAMHEPAPRIGHIQGYKGHIPNRSAKVAVSFGRATVPDK